MALYKSAEVPKRERIARLRTRLATALTTAQLRDVLKGLLDLLEDEL